MKKLVLFIALTVGFFAVFAQNATPTQGATQTNIHALKDVGTPSNVKPSDSKDLVNLTWHDCIRGWVISGDNYSSGIRFEPQHLQEVNGGKMVSVTFQPCHPSTQTKLHHDFCIEIYRGGTWGTTPNQGTLVYSQELDNDNLIPREFNTIMLTEPLLIDKFSELWVTVRANKHISATGSIYPFGVTHFESDPEFLCPIIHTYSNLLGEGGSWRELNATSGTSNWTMSAQVEPGEDINCAPATNLVVSRYPGMTDNIITYDCPGQQNTILAQCGAPSGFVVNFSGLSDYGAYHRFDAIDLAAVHGREFRKFTFSATYASTQDGYQNSYTAQVFQGGNWHADDPAERYEGQKLHEQRWEVEELQRAMTLVLDPPLVIDQTKEIWAGCYIEPIEDGAPYAFQYDDGPMFDGKGNLLLIDGEWLTWFETSDGERQTNWIFSSVVYTPPNATVNIYKDNGGAGVLLEENYTNFYNRYVHVGGAAIDCYFIKIPCPTEPPYAGGLSPATATKCPSGINDKPTTATKFSIVPNPARNQMTINANTDFTSYEIVNFLGQVVVSSGNSGNTATVNVSNLNNGVYFVRLFNNNGKPVVQKFVKN